MFQLRDDLLDWTMEEAELGKPVNEDFAEGVYTLPAVYTFSRPGYGEQLRDIAGKIMIRGSAGVSRGNEGLSVPSGKDKIPEAGGSEDAESRIRKEAVPFHGATSGESAFTPEDLAETRRIVREAGGIDYTLSVMKKLGDQANELLDPLPEDPRIGELRSVVSFLLKK
jgi:geranylgeranyl pyrophosphate synthase